MSEIGLYIHVPFCQKKCNYCDFYSVTPTSETVEKYFSKIYNEMLEYNGYSANTLYLGGGTPTLVEPSYIKKAIEIAQQHYNLNGEITIEANPNTLSEKKLQQYYDMGINRLSMGMQSAQPQQLDILGRTHSNQQVIDMVQTAQKIGFENISLDIMIATPKQTISQLMQTTQQAISLGVQHISAYLLKVEKGTEFDKMGIEIDDDYMADSYMELVEYLNKVGYKQYEISNFCKDGYESKHNLKYWNMQEFIGFGATAYSCLNGNRYGNSRELDYTRASNEQVEYIEEKFMLNLRLSSGIDLSEYDKLDLEKLQKLSQQGYIQINENRFNLTAEGFLISNSIINYLIEEVKA